MKIDMSNFDSTSFELFDINLVQKEVSGGEITIEQIDTIKEYPNAESIIISGLKQNTFEYFIKTYGKQFRAISFWKNKAVSDLSELSSLPDVEYINYFFNQKVTSLWDMSNNKKLVGLCISDFSKFHSLEGIETAPNLETFLVYDRVEGKMQLESLIPIVQTEIKHFCWGGKKILDNNFSCLANGKIEELDISPVQFTINELAQLLSLFPETLRGSITKPYISGGVKDSDGYTEYYFLCKNKRTCIKGKDDKRFQDYLDEFDSLLKKYRNK